jgi:hypothetical protein
MEGSLLKGSLVIPVLYDVANGDLDSGPPSQPARQRLEAES